MQLSQEQIDQAVADALPNVLAGLRREIEEKAIYHAKQTVQDEITKAVSKWMQAEVVPQILATLVESKDGLLKAADMIAVGIATSLGESMKASVVKKMESSWSRSDIFRKLFE